MTSKNRGIYYYEIDENQKILYHGTNEWSMYDIMENGIKEKHLQRRTEGYFGRGFYASKSKGYAKRYGRYIIHLEPSESAKALTVGDHFDGLQVEKNIEYIRNYAEENNYDMIEYFNGTEVLILNKDVVGVVDYEERKV